MSIYKDRKNLEVPARSLAEVHALVDDSRTTGNGWHLRATQYPTGDVEILAINLDYETSLKRGGGGKRKVSDKTAMDETTLKKSQYRSKKTVYQKILTLNADTLLTLTYRENQENLDLAWKHFRAFNKLMKKRYRDWQYVCVPERQKRGAIHFHLAIKGQYHWNTVRRFWKQAIQGEGNVDFRRRKDNGKYITNPRRIARYLAKYLTKQDMVEFNKRRYSSSKIELPEPITGWLALGVPVFKIMREIIERTTRLPPRVLWESEDVFLPMALMRT
ncbi:MAG: hypothetical protein ABW089_14780 [Sedimenticola sp.]